MRKGVISIEGVWEGENTTGVAIGSMTSGLEKRKTPFYCKFTSLMYI